MALLVANESRIRARAPHASRAARRAQAGRRAARAARMLGALPLVGLLAIPLAAISLHLGRDAGSPPDDAYLGLAMSSGVHGVLLALALAVAGPHLG